MDSVNTGFDFNSTHMDIPLSRESLVDVESLSDADQVAPEPQEVDTELLKEPFLLDEVYLGEILAAFKCADYAKDFIKDFMKLLGSRQKEIGSSLVQLADGGFEGVDFERAVRFGEASEDTRNTARNYRTQRTVTFCTFKGFHNWMRRQPDVRYYAVEKRDLNSNNNNDTAMVWVYSRGQRSVEFPFPLSFHGLGRNVEKYNSDFMVMFADKRFKPQIQEVDPLLVRTAVHMLLVGTIKATQSGKMAYDSHPGVTVLYRPDWRSAPIVMPPHIRTFYDSLWRKHFRTPHKDVILEMGSMVDYIVHILLKASVKPKLAYTSEPYSAISAEVNAEFDACRKGVYLPKASTEIENGVKSLALSRGFRGSKGELNDFTHGMYENKEIGPLEFGDRRVKYVAHSRVVARVHNLMIEKGYKSLAVFDHQETGYVEAFLKFAEKTKLPYAIHARVRMLGNIREAFNLIEPTDKFLSVATLQHTDQKVPKVDLVVFMEQKDNSAEKLYCEEAADVIQAALDIYKSVKPTVMIFPVKLSYVNEASSLATLLGTAEKLAVLPEWNRTHNDDIFLQLMGVRTPVKETTKDAVTMFNGMQIVISRRIRLINSVRDYLITGGYIEECLGFSLGPCAKYALDCYSFLRTVTVASKVEVTSWKPTGPQVCYRSL